MPIFGGNYLVTFLCGGLQGAKILEGLLRVIPQEELTVIVNTMDNVDICGLEIYPTLEYFLFLLAGKLDTRHWETIKNDTYTFMNSISHLMISDNPNSNRKEKPWFRFGDTLFSHSLFLKHLMNKGKSFPEVIEKISEKLGIKARVLPLTDNKISFKIYTEQGMLSFLEYRNKEIKGHIKEIKSVEYEGIDKVKVNPKVEEVLSSSSDKILIGPSNPPLNVLICTEFLTTLKSVKQAIEKASCDVIAISPVVGDEPIEEPLRRIMEEALGFGGSIIQIAERYKGLIDTLIIDEADDQFKEQIKEMGMEVIVTTIRLGHQEYRIKLAELVSKLLPTYLG